VHTDPAQVGRPGLVHESTAARGSILRSRKRMAVGSTNACYSVMKCTGRQERKRSTEKTFSRGSLHFLRCQPLHSRLDSLYDPCKPDPGYFTWHLAS
jgi:hypothetical protein